MATTGDRDDVFRGFLKLCQGMRAPKTKNTPSASSYVEKLQTFLSDDHSRQLVHRWRQWGYLLNSLLHVVKEEMGTYLNLGKSRKRKMGSKPKVPQLRYWHYLRTELQAAHVEADGPFLHLDPNGRDCISQLFSFCNIVVDRESTEYDRDVEIRVEKEAWLTVEELAQYRVYCAILERTQWTNALEVAMGSFTESSDLISDHATAPTRARVVRLLLRNCTFDVIELLPEIIQDVGDWFKEAKATAIDEQGDNADSLLLVVASSLIEMLSDLIRSHFSSIGPLMLKNGIAVLQFIAQSNKGRKNGLRGAPADFIVQFLELYRYNADGVPYFKYLAPITLLRELASLNQIVLSADEMNLMVGYARSARDRRMGALGINDQGLQQLACAADIVFHHDRLVSERAQGHLGQTGDDDLLTQAAVGDKRPRPGAEALAWETVIEYFVESPRTETQFAAAGSFSLASQRIVSTGRHASQTKAKMPYDPGSWLLLLLSILCRHGDYYVSNRIGDLMMVMKKLSEMLIVKEVGKPQSLALLILIQMANLSAKYRKDCSEYFGEHWAHVWRSLLRAELPYARATEGIGLARGQVGDAVLTLLNCCIGFGLISLKAIESSSDDLWSLPAFRQPTADSPAATMTRGDSSNPYARSSMASMCLLFSLLRRVQLPQEEDRPTRAANGWCSLEPDEEIFENEHASTRSRLLQSVFDHLRTQIFRKTTIMPTESAGNSFTKVDWQTELSSLMYAPILRSFCRQATSVFPDRESIFIPDLICKLSARNAKDCTSWITGDELNGFGVTFCMLESGLECLLSPFSASPTIDPMAFSPIIQAFLVEEVDAHRSSWYGGVDKHAMMPADQFEALAVPVYLMRGLIPVRKASHQFSCDNFRQHGHFSHAQSISKDGELKLETMIFELLSDLLTEIADTLREIGDNPIKKMRVLASSFDVGLVLSVFYAEEEETGSQHDVAKHSRLIPLLKQFFTVVAENFKPNEVVQTQQSHSVSESVMRILRKFHAVILILQGRQALKCCTHPCAGQIDLRFPPEIRPSIRSFVNTLEESLACLSGSNDASAASVPQSTMLPPSLSRSSSVRGISSWESTSGPLSNSLNQIQHQPREDWDRMNDGEEDDISRDRAPSRAIQKNISLWCFRLILLLKKDRGLSAVKKFAGGIHFEPDHLLALGVLLCGVAGADSLELFTQVIDKATEDGARERSRFLTKKGGSCRAPIFLSQVMSVLRLAGSIYEKRKYQHHEQVPGLLFQCARKYLEIFAEILPELQLGMAKIAQLQCFEVFFRLKLDEFEAFTEICPARLADKDMNVRIVAARGLQSIHHMYWEGGSKVFQHCFELLQGLLEAPPREVGEASKCDTPSKRGRSRSSIIDPRLCMDTCLSVLLSLYISACSSQLALPEVLGAFVDLSSSTTSLHTAGTPSLISIWMGAIAQYYGYTSVSSLLDDHFCELWQRFILASTHLTQQLEEEKSSERTENGVISLLPQGTFLLENFPLSTLLGQDLDSYSRRMYLVKQVDVIFPVGVFRNFISGQNTGVKGWDFEFVGELASYFSYNGDDNEGQVEHAFSNLGEQVTTDLFAFSFILISYPDPDLKTSAHQMLGIAEERAKTSELTLSHLGHIASKMARFTVWNLIKGDDERVRQSELWNGALAAMKAKYSEFEWGPINLAELLSEFYVILLRGELHDPRALCAVECFKIFADDIRDALTNNPVLQQLLLSICFQSIKHLAVGNRREVGSVLTLLVRDTCKCFMNSVDMFGQYIGTVVREIADILSKCSTPVHQESRVSVYKSWSKRKLNLTADDQAKLEWVIFAICNELGSGLGKFTHDVDLVPNGIAASLDKLNALIIESRKISSSAASQRQREYAVPDTSDTVRKFSQAQQHIEMFMRRERSRETKFYKPVLFSWSPDTDGVTSVTNNRRSGESVAAVHFNAMTKSIDTLRDATYSPSKLFGKLAHTLLYSGSTGVCGNAKCIQTENAVHLANALGELGALDASEYELSLADQEDELSRLYQRHFHRGALRETKTTFSLLMHERLLAYLSSLLFASKASGDLDSSVLEETLRTLKRVLNLDEGVAASARCKDGELKAFVLPFERSSPSNWSSASPRFEVLPGQSSNSQRKAPRTLTQMVELWTSATELGFTEWICLLTSCLARESSDPVLKACSALVSMREDMAVFLFPYVLESILQTPGGVAEPSRVAKAAHQGIQFIVTGMTSNRHGESGTTLAQENQVVEAMRTQPLEAVQLVIHSINFLREVEKARFVETNGGGEQKRKTKPQAAKQSRLHKLSYDCKVDLDLLAVARAAVRVKMPYSAMQYVEMWLEKQHGGKIPSLSAVDDDELGNVLRDILLGAYDFDSNDDGVYGVNDGRTLKSQLVKYHRESQYAKTLPLYDVSLQISQLQRQKSGEFIDSDPPHDVEGMLMSLQALGYNHLLEGYLQSLQRGIQLQDSSSAYTMQALEHKYELAWKSMQWDAVLPGLSLTEESESNLTSGAHSMYSHQQLLFQAIRAISHEDFKHLHHVTEKAKTQILQSVQLGLHSFESTKDSYSALVQLQSIHEIEEIAGHIERTGESNAGSHNFSASTLTGFSACTASEASLRTKAIPLWNQWRRRYSQIKNDFSKIESLLSLEEVLIQVSKPSDDSKLLAKLYLDLASFSRKAGRVAIAYRALLNLEQLEQRGCLEIQEMIQWKIQKAKLLWSQQEGRSAIWTAKKVCSEISARLKDTSLTSDQGTSLQLLQVAVLTITGKWIATQRSENSQVILEDYFQKATEIMGAMNAEVVSERARDAAKAHFALAEYMASMYQQVSTRVASREWLAGKKVTQARYEELQECQTMDEGVQMENRAHMHALNKEVGYDIKERAKVEASVDQFLIGAICSYGRGLSLSPRAELDMVFRVLSLWFNNQRKADINRIVVEEVIGVVPSYKFVPLSYQIISRISSVIDGDTFQAALRKLVMKLCAQHPHHALVQLIALKNSGAVEGKGALQFRTNVGDAKSEGAKVYLDELQRTEQRELLESLDIMANAYVQLALLDTRQYHSQKKKIPLSKVQVISPSATKTGTVAFDQCLRDRSRRANRVVMPAVLTARIAPQPDMDYTNVARILSFEPQFSITDSGIHRPKIIYCYGSDGCRYKQLVKGQDDTRQDLVIEQVFDTMNQFLMEERATRKRKLRLRTYRVVPLSPIAGVLEWVENTTPWGSYLVGRTAKKLSAHERYHPHELKHAECRQILNNATDKLAAFTDIQENFTPVFHHFFLEKFPDPVVWYHRRLAYTQSAAVTSIVGYILGIGDRHSQNILIHEDTGELVHIDFGVVFDQGMALFTPETVPFRLTRDMVDGMGVSGVDGVFSRCCEVTLQLLRKKSASVVTILEVFVHDPLYRWTLSPLKALRIQEGGQDIVRSATLSRSSSRSTNSSIANETGDSSNGTQPAYGNKAEPSSSDAAARALIRVKQKLEGYEDPNGNALSIEGQVKHLMSVAQDPHNLSVLFPGWAPWL